MAHPAARPISQWADGLWVAEGGCVNFLGAPYPTRCVIVRLRDGGLWIWSPVALGEELRGFVASTGPVRYLVSPNKLHHLFLGQWREAYPGASLWAPASTAAKRPDLRFDGILGDTPPPEWSGDIGQAWFRGSLALDEIVFHHRPSSTVIIADLVQTFSPEFLRSRWGRWRFVARMFGITRSQARAPLDLRLSFVHRSLARHARDKILAWDCRNVVVAHGECIRGDGHAQLIRSFSWLG